MEDALGVKRGTVRLVPHNPNWKALFEEEKELLLATFPNTILKISHGGSTAIPNIPAKPIIDMFAVVRSLSEADAIKDDLEKLGYEYVGERGVPERRLAVKGPEERRTHHLQIVEETSKEWTNHILIREYYLKHPEVAEEYARLKQDLAQKYPEDRVSYTNSKEDFIASVIERARKEKEQSEARDITGNAELRQKLGKLVSLENEENWWRPELFDANTRTHIPSELEIVSPPPLEDENYNCFVYALGLQNKSELLGNNGWEFTRNLGPVFDEMITNHILQISEVPSKGNLIVYRAQDKSISHVGLMENEQVVLSKWSWGPLIRHKIFDVPDHYGNTVEFYDITDSAVDYVLSKAGVH